MVSESASDSAPVPQRCESLSTAASSSRSHRAAPSPGRIAGVASFIVGTASANRRAANVHIIAAVIAAIAASGSASRSAR
eukprot:COSAG02_NODE_2318_length_9145_cov_41.373867_9_plen_80_part_00